MTFASKRFLQLLFIVLDMLLLNVGYALAQGIFKEGAESEHYMRYAQYLIIINGFWLLLAWMGEVYATKNITYFEKFLHATFRIFVLWAGLALLYLFLPRLVPLSSGLVLTSIALFLFGLIMNRIIYMLVRNWMSRAGHLHRKILILGCNNTGQKLATYLEKEGLALQIMGFVDDRPLEAFQQKSPILEKYSILGGIPDTVRIAKQLRVNEVYSTIMPENNNRVYNIMQEADKELIRFRLVADFHSFIAKPVHVDFLQDMPLLSIRREPLEEVINRMKKRIFDLSVSGFVAIFILSWLIPLLGLLIKLESKGPIFFVQLRSGKNNRPFRCYKFRSMGQNNDPSVQATKNDMRVTKVGRFIRKTSLDEFPQFLNVLKGEMSIVGPRPHMLKHTKNFANLADDYMVRQFLKPGITGWAQVNGYRGEIKGLAHIRKRVEYDLWYLENWSLWLDLRIIFLTVYNVFKGEENAY